LAEGAAKERTGTEMRRDERARALSFIGVVAVDA